jgi:hypothetical protein
MTRPIGYSRLHELVAMVAFVGVAFGLLQLSGCNAKGTVTGRVNFKGKPLPSGLVVFYDRDGNSYPAAIQRDGSYALGNVLCGPVKIAVGSMGWGRQEMPPPGYVCIPKHYLDPRKSGLELDVRRGLQVFMIDLNDDFNLDELSLGFD